MLGRPPADALRVETAAPSAYAFVEGVRRTRATLEDWRRRPWSVLRAWLLGSLGAALLLLVAVWVIAGVATPEHALVSRPPFVVGHPRDVVWVLARNLLVLALHAMACVAGFIAGSSLPLQARDHQGVRRWLHEHGGRFAIVFVIAATTFSLSAQALVIGTQAAGVAAGLDTSPGILLAILLPHAVPELTALFLPLAAWIIASRRGEWDQLLAATVVTVAIAVPILVAAAVFEVYAAPHLFALALG
ncbi:MAG: hypothetical protein QOD61_2041 [Solirubrobacteraceae bacterium]|nr:hypothetical protein [Solirubrobacteraceae bacterium]MEA2355912.1 hypothetical protein [Solirubrobacteraceae bacterium]